MDSSKAIGRRLRIWMRSRSISAAAVCKEIKCDRNRWSQYQNGKRRITEIVANKLCDRYGLTLEWIYRGKPTAEIPDALRSMEAQLEGDEVVAIEAARKVKRAKVSSKRPKRPVAA